MDLGKVSLAFTQQKIELPHDKEGEVDWKTLGNILAADILGEVHCASYVDPKYGRQANFSVATDWRFCYEERDVLVFRKLDRNTPINCFMGRGVVAAPVQDVAQYVGDIHTRENWDNLLVEAQNLVVITETDVIRYLAHESRTCVFRERRDFLFYERLAYVGDKYVQSAISIEHPDYPVPSGFTRAQLFPGTGFVVEPYKGNSSCSLITYVCQVDLKKLPVAIINRVIRRQPLAIHYIQKVFSPARMGKELSGSCLTAYEDTIPIRLFTTSDVLPTSTSKHSSSFFSEPHTSSTREFRPEKRSPRVDGPIAEEAAPTEVSKSCHSSPPPSPTDSQGSHSSSGKSTNLEHRSDKKQCISQPTTETNSNKSDVDPSVQESSPCTIDKLNASV